jgi:hypothetical protein
MSKKVIIEDSVVREALEALENLYSGTRDFAESNKIDISGSQTMLIANEKAVSLRSALDNAEEYNV